MIRSSVLKQNHQSVVLVDDDKSRLDKIKKVNRDRADGDFDNMLPVVDIPIPPEIVISCPKIRSFLSQALACRLCDRYNGIVQVVFNDKSTMPWDQKFAISCGFPVDRKCVLVKFDNIQGG